MGSIVAFISEKGGTGKSSCAANIAAVLSNSGSHVCVIEFDTNPGSTRDLGALHLPNPDDGKGLLEALVQQQPLTPIAITDELHVVPAGTYLQALPTLFQAWQDQGVNITEVMNSVISPLRNSYDYIFIDCAPGETSNVSTLVLSGADYAFIPTAEDDSSIEGAVRAISRVQAAKTTNPRLMLLGVALFQFDVRGTRKIRDVRLKLQAIHEDVHVFDAFIRVAKSPSVSARNSGLPVTVYDERIVKNAKPWWQDRENAYKIARNAGNVASDYRLLADEIEIRLKELAMTRAMTNPLSNTRKAKGA